VVAVASLSLQGKLLLADQHQLLHHKKVLAKAVLVLPILTALRPLLVVILLLIMDLHRRQMVHLLPLMDQLLAAPWPEAQPAQGPLRVAPPTQQAQLAVHREQQAALVRLRLICPHRSSRPPDSTLLSVQATLRLLPSIGLILRFPQARGFPRDPPLPVVRQPHPKEPPKSISHAPVALEASVRTAPRGVT
jgi:hypothetical protein